MLPYITISSCILQSPKFLNWTYLRSEHHVKQNLVKIRIGRWVKRCSNSMKRATTCTWNKNDSQIKTHTRHLWWTQVPVRPASCVGRESSQSGGGGGAHSHYNRSGLQPIWRYANLYLAWGPHVSATKLNYFNVFFRDEKLVFHCYESNEDVLGFGEIKFGSSSNILRTYRRSLGLDDRIA
jgi:hypothetical protein